jgi:hypothetical protein
VRFQCFSESVSDFIASRKTLPQNYDWHGSGTAPSLLDLPPESEGSPSSVQVSQRLVWSGERLACMCPTQNQFPPRVVDHAEVVWRL